MASIFQYWSLVFMYICVLLPAVIQVLQLQLHMWKSEELSQTCRKGTTLFFNVTSHSCPHSTSVSHFRTKESIWLEHSTLISPTAPAHIQSVEVWLFLKRIGLMMQVSPARWNRASPAVPSNQSLSAVFLVRLVLVCFKTWYTDWN